MRNHIRSVSRGLYLPLLVVGLVAAGCSTTPVESSATRPTEAMPSSTTIPPTTTTIHRGAQTVVVPELPPAVVDGVLTEGEWDGAAFFEMSDGVPIRLMRNDETLYLSVEGTDLGSVNVVMAISYEIWILHSSAALGSALYTPDGDTWELAHGFSWCCRDSSDTTARMALLETEGWQANIGFTGTPGIVEYEISMPWAGSMVAVSTIRSDEDTGFWPGALSDEARLQLIGVPPPMRAFHRAEWVVLDTADS